MPLLQNYNPASITKNTKTLGQAKEAIGSLAKMTRPQDHVLYEMFFT